MEYKSVLKFVGIALVVIVIIFVFSLAELYTQLARYRNYWNKQNTRTAQANEILYVALGDSTAQSIGASSAKKGYVGLVAKYLEQKYDRPVRTVNLSKSGAKINDVITTQLPAMKQLEINDDTIITMEIGANDMISYNAGQFESEMDTVMNDLPQQTIITDMPYFGESRFKRLEPQVKEANTIMYKLAAKHDFELSNLHERMQKNGGIKTFAPDWFHPSNTAYRENWAPAFTDRL